MPQTEESLSPFEPPVQVANDEPQTITLSFAGDCTLGMDRSFYYDNSFNAIYEYNGPEYFLQNVKDIFSQDDLTVVNFEGTLTDALERADKDWAFKGETEYAGVLSAGSVEVANLANNHSCDYWHQSYTDTQNALIQENIKTFGYDDLLIVDVNGIKVGFLGMYTVYSNNGYEAQLESYIESLENQGAEIIVANFHWDLENDASPEAEQIKLAHAAIDAGADLVIGHHPHILQGIEEYNGKHIVYSLGNFCFGGNSNPPDHDTMIFQATFTLEDGVLGETTTNIIPCFVSSVTWKNDYCPTPAQGGEAERILSKIEALSCSVAS